MTARVRMTTKRPSTLLDRLDLRRHLRSLRGLRCDPSPRCRQHRTNGQRPRERVPHPLAAVHTDQIAAAECDAVARTCTPVSSNTL